MICRNYSFYSGTQYHIPPNSLFINAMKPLLFLCLMISTVVNAQMGAVVFDAKVVEEKVGDVDGDGQAERIKLVNTDDSTGSGCIRELQIWKKNGRNWQLWISSKNAVLPSGGGGSYGDPFEYMEFEKGVLIIRQSGGNEWKWGQTDWYRLVKSELRLIRYESFYGKPCGYWARFSYDIKKGRAHYKKVWDACAPPAQKQKKEEEYFKYRLPQTITLQNRYSVSLSVKAPRLKQEIVF